MPTLLAMPAGDGAGWLQDPLHVSLALLIVATVVWYLAVRGAVSGLGPGRETWGLAIGGWMPAAAVGVWLTLGGHAAAGVAACLGVAVASLTLVLGLTLWTNPKDAQAAPRRGRGRAEPALLLPLPVGLALLLAGFRGVLAVEHALLLLLLGAAAIWLTAGGGRFMGNGARARPSDSGTVGLAGSAGGVGPVAGPGMALVAIAGVLAVCGAGFAAAGANWFGRAAGTGGEQILGSGMFGAMIALPLIGASSMAAYHGRGEGAVRGLALLAVLVLTLALPLVILLGVATGLARADAPAGLAILHEAGVAMPQRLWRVDTVVLVLVGLFLLPVALGRFRLTSVEGTALVLLYVAYLVLSVRVGV